MVREDLTLKIGRENNCLTFEKRKIYQSKRKQNYSMIIKSIKTIYELTEYYLKSNKQQKNPVYINEFRK